MCNVGPAVVKRPIAGRGVAMFWPSCGTRNVDGSAFCNKCGNSLTTQVAQSLDATKPPPPPASTPRESTSHGPGDVNRANGDVKTSTAKTKARRPPYKINRLWLLLIIAIIIIIVVAHNTKKSNPNSATQTTVAGNTSSATTTTAPVTYSLVTVMPDRQGSGQSSLPAFNIPSDARSWFLLWAYNCSGFGSSGNFIVNVDGLGNTQTTDAGVNELGMSGKNVENYYDTGRFQLVVNSECNWAVNVTASEPG